MYVLCNSCNKEFNDLADRVRYSSTVKGVLWFCSGECCKNYLNRPGNAARGRTDRHALDSDKSST
jgi:hypothetical protein